MSKYEDTVKSVRLNNQTVGNLKKYLDRFPNDAKVFIVDGQYKNRDCQICCNFDHQEEKNTVQFMLGDFINNITD